METEGDAPVLGTEPSHVQQSGKTTDELNSSEDEGIFESNKAPTAIDGEDDDMKMETHSQNSKVIEDEDEKDKDKESPSKSMMIVMSDDDSDVDTKNILSSSRRRRKPVLSDDDEESNSLPARPTNKTFDSTDEENGSDDDSDRKTKSLKKKRILKRIGSDSDDSDSDILVQKPFDQPETVKTTYKYNNDLFDAELSDEEKPIEAGNLSPSQQQYSDDENNTGGKSTKQKKKKGPSLKERQQEVMEIHSETQRMVRESQISLPYHKPKQRTLAEFLERRKKAAPVRNIKHGSLKMSMRNIETLRLLEEKKKEVEEFYKSDSDQEDPDDQDWTPDKNPEEDIEAVETKDTKEPEAETSPAAVIDEEITSVPQVSVVPTEEKDGNEESGSVEKADDPLQPQVGDQGDKPVKTVDDSGIQSGTSSSAEDSQPEQIVEMKDVTDTTVEDNSVCNAKAPEENHQEDTDMFEIEEEYLPKSAETPDNVMAKKEKKLETPKLSLLASKLPDLDLNKITNATPKLSLGKDCEFIDLDEETTITPKNPGLSELMNRFVRHSNAKRKPVNKQQVNLSIITKEKDMEGAEKLVSSSILVNLDAEDEEMPTDTVPGARHLSLKTALKAKIQEQRERERVRRVKERQFMESEQVIEDYQDDDGTFLDEDKELTDQSDTDCETESEPEENDIIIKDKKRKKNKYLDEEADEDEDMQDNAEEDDGDDDAESNSDDGDDDRSQEPEDEDSNDTVELVQTQKKRTITDDDDDEDDSDQLKLQWEESQDVNMHTKIKSLIDGLAHTNTEDMFASQAKKVDSIDKDASITSMDSSFELFGSVIPGHQPGGGLRRSVEGLGNETEGDTAFLTPLTKNKPGSFTSTGRDLSLPIENSQDLFMSSAPHSAPGSPSAEGPSLHLTPIEDSQFVHQEKQKEVNPMAKLKLDFTGIEGTQSSEELIGLCSGQFTGGKEVSSKVNQLCEDAFAPTQDINNLMGLCSGSFNMQTDNKDQPRALSSLTESEEKKSNDEDDDEDELLGLCTGKFTTQKTKSSKTDEKGTTEDEESKLQFDDDRTSSPVPEMVVYSSDEEEPEKRQKKKKRRRIIAFSDDEDAQGPVEYDDEENEILPTTFSGFKDNRKGGIRAEFLENEAELSGSELGSDDEYEGGQDMLEEEEGDKEHYDVDDLRDQVGRAHLKTLIDSDKREIRLLQEMYLEDGEMHGEGRQRKFRWKNIDDNDENERKMESDEEQHVGEDELEDAEWRKQRYEREKFLKEQKEKQEEPMDTEMFKISSKPLIRAASQSSDSSSKREPLKTANSVPTSAPAKKSAVNPFCMLSKRGSFLSRDKNTLSRIAELTKDKGSVVGGAKQAGNFVFQQLSAEEVQQKESAKLKKSASLPTAKRARLDRSFFSMEESKQSTSIFKHF